MIVLLGYMGSGKSLIGKKLAAVLQQDFFDLDQLIEQKTGLSIPQIFAKQGEIKFRILEAEVLNDHISKTNKGVLALGGGTPCYAANMDRLLSAADVKTIYLKTDLDTLVQRLWPEKSQRPLIAHLSTREDLLDFIRKHLFDRSPYYMQAEMRVDTSVKSPDEIVEDIVGGLF